MEFHAYHGCLTEEKTYGNRFMVDVAFDFDASVAAKSDALDDTLPYTEVYDVVRQEMNIPSNLIEHVCNRIADRLLYSFPQIMRAEVKVSKFNPPMMGKMHSVAILMQKERTSNKNR
jgi:dihydroneopterin aldolase